MTTAQPRSLYYGWIMMILCMACLMLVVGTTTNAFPLYVLPVSEAYGLSRATMNTGMILMNAGSAISALIVGRLLDRYSARIIMGASALILGVCLITLGLSHDIRLSAVVISLPVGFAMSGIGTLTAPALVARWFVVHRGRAMAITMMGNSLGTIFMVPPMAWLIDQLGWRNSLVTVGASVVVIIFLLLPFVRNAPGPDDRETEQSPALSEVQADPGVADIAFTTRQLFAMPRFWAIGLSIGIAMGVFQGVLVSLVPMGHGIGLSNPVAASLISVLGIAAILAKFGVAFLGDRFDRTIMLACAYLLMALSGLTLFFAQSYAMMVAGCVLQGLAAGVTMPLYLALLADQFGARSFGNANGNITFLISVLGACAVRFSGEVFDRTGGYGLMFLIFIALVILSAILLMSIRRSGPGVGNAVRARDGRAVANGVSQA